MYDCGLMYLHYLLIEQIMKVYPDDRTTIKQLHKR